mgnify:CR=1 FL=1
MRLGESNRMKSKLEYIWLDGSEPTQCLRSKTMVRNDFGGTVEECPVWSFDGSSTNQATGDDSDCLLKPVAIYPDPDRASAYLVMCEVLNADGTPHPTNGRATIQDEDEDFWFGFEQEYFLWDPKTDLPPGFPKGGYPAPQGPYYCSVGARNAFGRELIEEHMDICLEAGGAAASCRRRPTPEFRRRHARSWSGRPGHTRYPWHVARRTAGGLSAPGSL